MSPQLLQKFKELIPTMGLTKDMLAILPKSGECQEGTGWHAQPFCMGTLHGDSGHCPWYVCSRFSLLFNRSVHLGHQVSVAGGSQVSLMAWPGLSRDSQHPREAPTCLGALHHIGFPLL